MTILKFCLISLSFHLISLTQAQSIADNWHQFRGPENNGVSRTANPPLEWSEKKNLLWKVALEGHGTSSPIVWGNKVFVLSAKNTGRVDPSLPKPEDQPERVFGIKFPNTTYEMIVQCFDRKTGKPLWRDVAKQLVPHEGHHKDASFASATPFCDGERLYCWFGSAGMFAYSLDGKMLWERDLGKVKIGASLGEGSSPVVHNGKIVLVRDHDRSKSSIEVLNAADGKTLWKKDRDEKNAWATPAIAEHNGVTQVITSASKQVCSYNLDTGEIIWWTTGLTSNCTPCPIVDGETVYCMSGYQGHALLAIPITGTGDVTEAIVWKEARGTPYVPSPILYDGQLYYTQSNQNILTSRNASDGSEIISRVRIPELGDIYASPVGAKGRIYFTGRKGTTVVIERGEELKVLATNELGDNFHASPALAGSQIFLRGMRFLYCLQEGGKAIGTEVTSKQKAAPTQPPAKPKQAPGDKQLRQLLETIAKRDIPKDYPGGKGHQPFVDKWFANAPPEKAGQVGRLWKEQRRLFPNMKNKGASFIRILDYVRSKGNNKLKGNPHIKKKQKAEIRREAGTISPGPKGEVAGSVKSQEGKPMGGVMVSAFDDKNRQSISVFSRQDGSFQIDQLHKANYRIRARLPGQQDKWIEGVKPVQQNVGVRSSGRSEAHPPTAKTMKQGLKRKAAPPSLQRNETSSITILMEPAIGEELELQRPASDAFAQLHFDSPRDRLNFKMMCSYCHQIGTPGFRTPEKPVDWETMIRRMDGFGGLYPHTKETIVQRIIDTYKDDAVTRWPTYVPPPAPTGMVAKTKITTWEMGEPYEGSFHDLEIGDDGLAYVVHIGKQYTATLNPKTGERIYYRLPRGSQGPHSIEPDNEGDMWLTLCVSGEMAKFDLETKEYTILSSAVAPAKRGSWPHTLRVDPKDPKGIIWYTDAGRNSVFSLDPKTLVRKEYHLLDANQVKAGGKGESRGITPYGLDYSPIDGTIWYSKLNGNRIGRIDPKAPDGNATEWNPPFRGPRRLHVAPDGMVWVPGFGSGVFGKFDPTTEKWTTYPLPDYLNQIPYALNVAPDGMVWICGTGNDTLYRFNPKTEYLVEFPLPHRVSYTREIEFDKDGNVWTSTSGPARHMENVCGTVIKLEILDTAEEGGIKLSPIKLSSEEQGIMTEAQKQNRSVQLGSLLAKIEARAIPDDYKGGKTHQAYVERVMSSLTKEQRGRVGRLFHQRRQADAKMENAGHSFIRILDYVAKGGKATEMPAEPGPDTVAEKTKVHRLNHPRRSSFDAFVYVNRIPDQPHEGETAEKFAGRIHGRLANQEGRVQLKLPPGMDRAAYRGFKAFLGPEGNTKKTNCIGCHSPPDFALSSDKTLRDHQWAKVNRGQSESEPCTVGHSGIKADFSGLVAFLDTLRTVSDSEFRDLIVEAKVVDVASPQAPVAPGIQLTGTVRFEGGIPKRRLIHMDEASRRLYGNEKPLDESILISQSGGLANVFVYIKNPPEGSYPSPGKSAIIDQEKSIFHPRVQGLRVGQQLLIKNGDPYIHNIRSLSRKNRPFNIVQPPGTPDRQRTFEKAEGPISIKCDFHPWMTAHFWVMDHPFFAVTDAEGKFAISDLPVGKYTLTTWHEVYGEQEVEVAIIAKAEVKLVFKLKPQE